MQDKIMDRPALARMVSKARDAEKIVVFTNGCFDILHAGHARYLAAARKEGDLLVVGLNSDKSVVSIKGDKRPLTPQAQRAEVLAALLCVDAVVLFDGDTPEKLISEIVPHVLVKGADWQEHQIAGASIVKNAGGRVVRIPLVPGISTTGIIKTIVERHCPKP